MPLPTEPEVKPASRPSGVRSFRWLLANGLVLGLALLGVWRLLPSRDAAATSAKAAPLAEVRPGWWETRQAIYYHIPARVLFRVEGDPARARSIADAAWREFERLGCIFNPFDPSSEVGRLNEATLAGQRRSEVSPDLLAVMRLSRRLAEASDGRFDPTIWPLRQAWRQAVEAQQPPTDAQLADALAQVGFDRLVLPTGGETAVTLPPAGLRFDFGGIAKGYAVDRVEQILRAQGVEDALIQLGGEVSTFGDNDGKPWRIGVQHPRNMEALWGVMTQTHASRVSTSGNYRQPLQIGEKAYYHIFDPRSGQPVPTRVLGVTTADLRGNASNALLDGAATAITALGPEAGLALADRLGIDVLVLVEGEDGKITEVSSEGFGRCYRRSMDKP